MEGREEAGQAEGAADLPCGQEPLLTPPEAVEIRRPALG